MAYAKTREGRLAAWLKAQTTDDLICASRKARKTADIRIDMLGELIVRQVSIPGLTAEAMA